MKAALKSEETGRNGGLEQQNHTKKLTVQF